MAELALAATVIGGAVSAVGTLAAGGAAKDAGYFKAAQEEQAGQESRAASQRASLEQRRQAGLALSKVQAGAAASGAGASDPGILKIAGDIAGRGEYQALTEMYKGENRGRGLEDQAMGDRMSGDAAQEGSYYKAAGTALDTIGKATLLSKGGSFYDRYRNTYG